MRAPRWSRWVLAILLVLVAGAAGVLAGQFVTPIFTDSSKTNQSGYLGTVLGGISFILGIVPAVLQLVRDPDPTALLADMKRRQREVLNDRFRILKLNQSVDVELNFEEAVTASRWDLYQMAEYLVAGKRIALTGAPGSGKSYTATKLALDVLKNDDGVLPIIVPLSRWRFGEDIGAWLSAYVAKEFNLSQKSVREPIASGQIIPIFDALEELEGSPAGAAGAVTSFLDAVLAWQEAGRSAPLLITAQSRLWATLEQRHRQHHTLTVLRIRSVIQADAAHFISRALFGINSANGTQAIVQAIEATGDANNLRLPWRLVMITQAMRPWTLADGSLRAGALTELTRILQPGKLVEAFVLSCALRGKTKWARLRAGQDLWWLCFFARYLTQHATVSGSVIYGRQMSFRDIELHRLWPAAGKFRARVVDFLMCATLSLPGFLWALTLLWERGALARVTLIVGSLVWLALLIRTSTRPWVPAANWGWQRLSDPTYYLKQLGASLLLGVLAGLIFSPLLGLAVFATSWVIIGLVVGFGQTLATDSEMRIVDPAATLRNEHRISRISAWAMLPLFTVGLSVNYSLLASFVLAATYCLIVGETVGCALWRRYLATVLSAPISMPPSPNALFERARVLGSKCGFDLSIPSRRGPQLPCVEDSESLLEVVIPPW